MSGATRKKVDPRIRALIENGVKENHRSLFVLVGDHGKDQVVNLHYILSKAQVKARPSVLWCYKKELGFSTHRKKRMRMIKKQVQRGLYEADKDDPFDLFISSTNIRWAYYKDSAKILGQTYGMCVLQDFEALTPNLLARTVETVEGGGIVVLLLRTISSLKQLFTMTMDVHSRFRTESHGDVTARFNERFILSLASCPTCAVLDDELNLLPLSKHIKHLKPISVPQGEEDSGLTGLSASQRASLKELNELKASLSETQPIGALIDLARTMDQARAVLTFAEAISEKTLRSTVALTAGRGRGKSAALGVALATSIAYGYANVFITAPSPENLGTVFEFVFKGLDALGFKEHADYEVLRSANPELGQCVVRVNVFRDRRQTIQYILPQHCDKLAQAELLAIDEAAAIPLPVVKKLLGPYLVFMSSTINGYEGTGRSLSLKLISQLRENQGKAAAAAAHAAAMDVHGNRGGVKQGERMLHEDRWKTAAAAAAALNNGDAAPASAASLTGGGGGVTTSGAATASGRVLREVTLETPIRYAPGDKVEQWLGDLLCLDAAVGKARLVGGTPHPSKCGLYYVNRDALFSYHKLSEAFLQRLMHLFVASHYKNTPNDLQLLSDAPAHHLFALLGPSADSTEAGGLPDVLCVVQVALEGKISKASVQAALSRGHRASGDLIPWTLGQQFDASEFPSLSGARVVRVATNPDVQGMGYGSRALELLKQYYQGDISQVVDEDEEEDEEEEAEEEEDVGLAKEKLKPRKKLPPLLLPLDQRRPERLHWLGTSFGLTGQLFRFWHKAGYRCVYLRQTANDLTGEHSAIMLQELNCSDLPEAPQPHWCRGFVADAQRRLVTLLSSAFRGMAVETSLSLLDARDSAPLAGGGAGASGSARQGELSQDELGFLFSPLDLRRLQLYAQNLVDYHMVVDLLPPLSRLVFARRTPAISLSSLQMALLLGVGLQNKSVDDLTTELGLPANQVMAMFNKAVKKLSTYLRGIQEKHAAASMGLDDASSSSSKKKRGGAAAISSAEASAKGMEALPTTLRAEQESGAKEASALVEAADLMEYAIGGTDDDWSKALEAKGGKAVKSGVQLKGKASAVTVDADGEDVGGGGKKEGKKSKSGSESGKKRRKSEGGGGGKKSKKYANLS